MRKYAATSLPQSTRRLRWHSPKASMTRPRSAHSDTTRTVCLGQPTEEMREVYEIVRQAQAAGIAAAKGGALGSEIDGAARKVITDAGYGPCFGHSFGHCLGMEIHEPPYAAARWDKPIPAGAVISAEPGIYLPGKFGVRIEDVLFITEDGNEDITNLSRDLLVLDF